MIEEIRKLKVIRHTDFAVDTLYRLDCIEPKINEIIEGLNKVIEKVNKVEGWGYEWRMKR